MGFDHIHFPRSETLNIAIKETILRTKNCIWLIFLPLSLEIFFYVAAALHTKTDIFSLSSLSLALLSLSLAPSLPLSLLSVSLSSLSLSSLSLSPLSLSLSLLFLSLPL